MNPPKAVPMYQDDDADQVAETATAEDLELWNAKLVLATNHAERNTDLKSAMSKEIGSRVKHYRKVQRALAAAIRDKSPIILEDELGQHWERELADLKPRDMFHDGLQVWRQQAYVQSDSGLAPLLDRAGLPVPCEAK